MNISTVPGLTKEKATWVHYIARTEALFGIWYRIEILYKRAQLLSSWVRRFKKLQEGRSFKKLQECRGDHGSLVLRSKHSELD
jgi:hypothetical protein